MLILRPRDVSPHSPLRLSAGTSFVVASPNGDGCLRIYSQHLRVFMAEELIWDFDEEIADLEEAASMIRDLQEKLTESRKRFTDDELADWLKRLRAEAQGEPNQDWLDAAADRIEELSTAIAEAENRPIPEDIPGFVVYEGRRLLGYFETGLEAIRAIENAAEEAEHAD